jgi:hypothetical protein
MNRVYLSESQVESVAAVLSKFGIESPGLMEELTDHFSGEIEEKMKKGESFEAAFDEFVANNSWLKLRKLEHAYVKYKEKSLRRFILDEFKSLWLSPKAIVPVVAVLAVLYLLRQDGDLRFYGVTALHAFLVVQTLTLAIWSVFRYRKYRSVEMTYLVQLGFAMIYFVLFPLWRLDYMSTEEIVVKINEWMILGYYAIVFHLAYLHLSVFRRCMAGERINQLIHQR